MIGNPAPLRAQTCDIAGCNHQIIWTRSSTGRPMPVDAQPSDQGNVLVDATQRGADGLPYSGVLGRGAAAGARAAGKELRTHHRLSCVHPEQWARGGAR